MFINEARLMIGKDDSMKEVKRENIDRFESICSLKGVHAQVGVNVGTSIGYGDMKIDASVTLTCDQTEEAMDEAARLALEVAHTFMNAGLKEHGLPEVLYDAPGLWKQEGTAPETPDRFASLCSGRGALAHIGVNVGTTIGFGEVKLKSNVRLACDQNAEKIHYAGCLAIEKSNVYTRWGLSGYPRTK